jgi:hypothetical protein
LRSPMSSSRLPATSRARATGSAFDRRASVRPARADAVARAVGRVECAGGDHENRLWLRAPSARRGSLALRPAAAHRSDASEPPARAARSRAAGLPLGGCLRALS